MVKGDQPRGYSPANNNNNYQLLPPALSNAYLLFYLSTSFDEIGSLVVRVS